MTVWLLLNYNLFCIADFPCWFDHSLCTITIFHLPSHLLLTKINLHRPNLRTGRLLKPQFLIQSLQLLFPFDLFQQLRRTRLRLLHLLYLVW